MRRGLKCISDPNRRKYLALVLNEIKSEFRNSLVSCVLYGSVARGDDDKHSDIDLLLVLDTDMSYGERCTMLGRVLTRVYKTDLAQRLLEMGYNIFVEFYPLNITEASVFRPIYLDMIHDAVILYDRNNFFEKVLNRVSKLLKKLGSKRIWLGEKEWIWVIKPDICFGEEVSYELE
ncbi:MAG: nucleotidyltransferase domain-containing protein [Thermoprotei archaeon]|nr:MAG: nucleotidyltransferase domain-containing protein [Thermoprotei archaeon]RLF19632.1 MAG: nucleotidyltransferase domain-containing protein [Thermoprotei archaeon]